MRLEVSVPPLALSAELCDCTPPEKDEISELLSVGDIGVTG